MPLQILPDPARQGRAAIKAILVMGGGVFLLLLIVSLGLQKSLRPDPSERVRIRQKFSPFDSTRAIVDLRNLLEKGPRPAGTGAAAATRAYIKQELTASGHQTWEQPFSDGGVLAGKTLINLVAISRGTAPGIIVFGAHYDTALRDDGFSEANSAGSGAAWLLEWARALGPHRAGATCWFVWFDAAEVPARDAKGPGLYGSRAFLEYCRQKGEIQNIRAVIIVEAIGDCYLKLAWDPNAPEWLRGTVWDTALRLRYDDHFSSSGPPRISDQSPFRNAGLPALLLMDPLYGGSALEHQKYWRSAEDTLNKVCPQSLQAVADVLYHALPAIEGQAETLGTPVP